MISEAQPYTMTKVYLTGLTETATLFTHSWFMVSTMQSLRTQEALASHALLCIPNPSTFILRSLYLRLWVEVHLWRGKKNPEDTFPQSDSVPSTFPFLAIFLSPSPFLPQCP